MAQSEHKTDRRRKGILAPLILIGAGIFFLLGNLGLLEEGAVGLFLRYWPALIILWGISSLLKREGILGPAVLVGIGSTFLFANLDLIQLSPWLALTRLWPVLIIAIGIDLVLGRRSTWLSVVGLTTVLVIFGAGLWYAETVIAAGLVDLWKIEAPLGEFETAEIRLQPAVSTVALSTTSDSRNLIEGTVSFSDQETFSELFDVENGHALYVLRRADDGIIFKPWDTFQPWTLTINKTIPLALDINLGVGDAVLDLAGLSLTDLDITAGVGNAEIILAGGEYDLRYEGGVGQTHLSLPNSGEITIRIDQGVGSIVIAVPAGMAVRIDADRGIAGLQYPTGYSRNGDVVTSPGYSIEGDYVDISIDLGVGNVMIVEN